MINYPDLFYNLSSKRKKKQKNGTERNDLHIT